MLPCPFLDAFHKFKICVRHYLAYIRVIRKRVSKYCIIQLASATLLYHSCCTRTHHRNSNNNYGKYNIGLLTFVKYISEEKV